MKKKFLNLLIITIILMSTTIILTGCGKNGNKGDDNAEKKQNTNVSNEPNNTVLKKGVTYADSSRNIDKVDVNKFSFYLDEDHKTILSYSEGDTDIKHIRVRRILNAGKCSGASFGYNPNGAYIDFASSHNIYINVSTDQYTTIDGKPFMTESKKTIEENENYKFYSEYVNSAQSRFEYVKEVDGIDVHFYAVALTRDKDKVKQGAEEISKLISKDKGYGFLIDWYINSTVSNQEGYAFKSFDTIKIYERSSSFLTGGSVIELDGRLVDYYSQYGGDRNKEIKDGFVKLYDLKDAYIGYEIIDNKDLYIYLYHTKVNDEGKTVKDRTEDIVRIQDFEGSKEDIENIAKAYKDSIIEVEK